MFSLFYTKTVGQKLIHFIEKLTRMTLLTILFTIQNTQSKTFTIWPKRIIVFVSDKKKINERLSELKTWLLLCSYLLAIIEKASFNAKLQGPAPKKRRDSYSVCINTQQVSFEKYFHYNYFITKWRESQQIEKSI